MTERDAQQALPKLPQRPDDAHKGTFGTVVVIGGSAQMVGAPALAARAALRAGAGLVRIAAPNDLLVAMLVIEPSATGLAFQYNADYEPAEALDRRMDRDDVLVVGPGMGMGREQCELVEGLLRQPRPIVLDADGLNNLAEVRDATLAPRCPLVMTPHPGEFNRLADAAELDVDPVDPDARPDAAAQLAVKYNAVVLLKGHRSIISDGKRTAVNTTGNPALATAGTGDVLAGAIAGLIAQGLDRFDAAVLAAHLHGAAADLWAQKHGPTGLRAHDLADLLPCAMLQHTRR